MTLSPSVRQAIDDARSDDQNTLLLAVTPSSGGTGDMTAADMADLMTTLGVGTRWASLSISSAADRTILKLDLDSDSDPDGDLAALAQELQVRGVGIRLRRPRKVDIGLSGRAPFLKLFMGLRGERPQRWEGPVGWPPDKAQWVPDARWTSQLWKSSLDWLFSAGPSDAIGIGNSGVCTETDERAVREHASARRFGDPRHSVTYCVVKEHGEFRQLDYFPLCGQMALSTGGWSAEASASGDLVTTRDAAAQNFVEFLGTQVEALAYAHLTSGTDVMGTQAHDPLRADIPDTAQAFRSWSDIVDLWSSGYLLDAFPVWLLRAPRVPVSSLSIWTTMSFPEDVVLAVARQPLSEWFGLANSRPDSAPEIGKKEIFSLIPGT